MPDDVKEVPKALVRVPDSGRSILTPDGMSLKAFQSFVIKHHLTEAQSGLVIEINRECNASIPYVGRLLDDGFKLCYIQAAYRLRDELGTLANARDYTDVILDSELPIGKSCVLLMLLYPNRESLDDEDIESVADLVCSVADECPDVFAWSIIISRVIESLPLKNGEDESLLDVSPREMTEGVVGLSHIGLNDTPERLTREEIEVLNELRFTGSIPVIITNW